MKARTGRSRLGDAAIGIAFLVVFAAAYLRASAWPYRTKMFPELAAGVGFALTLLLLVLAVRSSLRGRDQPPEVAGAATESDDGDTDRDVEYAFATAARRTWAAALGWVAAFFALLALAGLYVTAPLFSLIYLRVVGRLGWFAAGAYAVALGLVLFVTIGLLLRVPVPAGVVG